MKLKQKLIKKMKLIEFKKKKINRIKKKNKLN